MSEILDNAIGKPFEVFIADSEDSLKEEGFLVEHPAALGFSKDKHSIVFAGETFGLSEADKRKLDILYKLVVDFSLNPSKGKKGSVTRVVCSWTISVNDTDVDPQALSIKNGGGSPIGLGPSVRSYTFTGISNDSTFTLNVDGTSYQKTIVFYNPNYLKVCNSSFPVKPSVGELTALMNGLNETGYGARGYKKDNLKVGADVGTPTQRIVYLYPKVLGKLTSILNGSTDVTSSFTMSEVRLPINGEEEDYYVYVQTDASNVEGSKIEFK